MSEPLHIVVGGHKIYENTKGILNLQDDDVDSEDFSSFYMRAVQRHQSNFGVIKIQTSESQKFWEGIEVIRANSDLLGKTIRQIGLPPLEKVKGKSGSREMANIKLRTSKDHVSSISYNFKGSNRSIKSVCRPSIASQKNSGLQEMISRYFSKPPRSVTYPTDLTYSLLKSRPHSFNLSSIPNLLNQHEVPVYPGIQEPYFYIGINGSVSSTHIEDLGWAAWNLAHRHDLVTPEGKAVIGCKIWVCPKPKYYENVVTELNKSVKQMPPCKNILMRKCYILQPQWYIDRNIEFDVFFQQPGDIILALPKGIHAVINIGLIFNEAGNFAYPDWTVTAKNVNKCNCNQPECLPSKFDDIPTPKELLKKWQSSGKGYTLKKYDKRIEVVKIGCTYKCTFCEFTSLTKSDAREHVDLEHHPKKHICEVCGKPFRTQKIKYTHKQRVHLKKNRIPCMCGKRFFTRWDLDRHMKICKNIRVPSAVASKTTSAKKTHFKKAINMKVTSAVAAKKTPVRNVHFKKPTVNGVLQ